MGARRGGICSSESNCAFPDFIYSIAKISTSGGTCCRANRVANEIWREFNFYDLNNDTRVELDEAQKVDESKTHYGMGVSPPIAYKTVAKACNGSFTIIDYAKLIYAAATGGQSGYGGFDFQFYFDGLDSNKNGLIDLGDDSEIAWYLIPSGHDFRSNKKFRNLRLKLEYPTQRDYDQFLSHVISKSDENSDNAIDIFELKALLLTLSEEYRTD